MVPVPGGYCHFRLVILNLQTLLTYLFGRLVFIGISRIALVPDFLQKLMSLYPVRVRKAHASNTPIL